MNAKRIESAYADAHERYAKLGVDTEAALTTLKTVSLSVHCWQGDDVGGFENRTGAPGGGLAVTGGRAGRARNADELRADMNEAFSLIPGRHRANIHAMYGEFGEKAVDRDEIGTEHFAGWVDWSKENGLGLDFNPTLFAHPMADGGTTLSSRDETVRDFWIEHVRRCREIGDWIGGKLGTTCLNNLWIPDGAKDRTVSRFDHRESLRRSLDAIYTGDFDESRLVDSVESKLFGIGSEAYVAGSHEFYLLWASRANKHLCLDMGHFHPTESVADKISAILPYLPGIVLHVSRGVRWDSDHVVLFEDELRFLMEEVVRADALPRVRFALDYFDGEMNRVGAWVAGARATLKALLTALLEPIGRLRAAEADGDSFGRLALLEESKALPMGAVWDMHCLRSNVPAGADWIGAVEGYEKRVLSKRG